MPRLQIWTGVKKLWMKNIDAEQSEAWKILDKNDEKIVKCQEKICRAKRGPKKLERN